MMKQIYFNRIEQAIKIIRTYNIMINGQGNYKTLPHYMKVFGDFCVDYLKYKVIEEMPELRHEEKVIALLEACKEKNITVVESLLAHVDLVEKCKEAKYTDVSECISVMPITTTIIEDIAKALNLEM